MSPAGEIHAAAQLLRERTEGTSALPWGQHDTWLNDGGYTEAVLQRDPETGLGVRPIAWAPSFSNDPGRSPERDRSLADARWMAMMSPALAKPLAAMLESEANRKHVVRTPHTRGILGGWHGSCSCGETVIEPGPEPAECGRLGRVLALARIINAAQEAQ